MRKGNAMRKWLLAAVLATMPGTALAEDIYLCADTKTAGIVWDENYPQGDGRVTSFDEDRFVLKVISEARRDITPTTGEPENQIDQHLTCRSPWPETIPAFLACMDESGLEVWAFNGNRFTHAYLFGSTLGIEFAGPNIWVSHGICTKF